ncbi:MAG: ABC transporter ATP-binding protein [Proteobacteria bacterium]|nr:ABC transporter ATP-binding protein [Pseudomonadota bacterium]
MSNNSSNSTATAPLLTCNNLSKAFESGGNKQIVLDHVSCTVERGEVVAIVGSSGSGKTTLLHLLGGLDSADSGSICYHGEDINTLSDGALTRWRNRHLAFVFQFHLLLPEFSALENVAMPLLLRRLPRKQALAQAAECLAAVNLSQHQHKTPEKLSGGERQRAAVARALAGQPAFILADEPTGNLDRKNADAVFNTLFQQCRARKMALMVVSHDERLAEQADRRLMLQDGVLTSV